MFIKTSTIIIMEKVFAFMHGEQSFQSVLLLLFNSNRSFSQLLVIFLKESTSSFIKLRQFFVSNISLLQVKQLNASSWSIEIISFSKGQNSIRFSLKLSKIEFFKSSKAVGLKKGLIQIRDSKISTSYWFILLNSDLKSSASTI